MKIIIDSDRYGQRSEFPDLQSAVEGVRACGPGFETTEFSVRADGAVLDEDGHAVGFEVNTVE